MPQRRYGGYGGGYYDQSSETFDPYSKWGNVGLTIRNTIAKIVAKRKEEQEKAKKEAQEKWAMSQEEQKLEIDRRRAEAQIRNWDRPEAPEKPPLEPEEVRVAREIFKALPPNKQTTEQWGVTLKEVVEKYHPTPNPQRPTQPTDYDKRVAAARVAFKNGAIKEDVLNKVVLGIAEEQESGLSKTLKDMVKNGIAKDIPDAWDKYRPKQMTAGQFLMQSIGLGGGEQNKPKYTIGERKTINGETREFVGYDKDGKDLWKLVTK